MINRDELKTKLKKYNYQVKEQYGEIIVKLDSSVQIKINETEDGRVIITDKLIGYNMLTGVWSMSFKRSIIFNTILAIFYMFLFIYITIGTEKDNTPIVGVFFLIFAYSWIILWTIYYLIKIENFKTLLMSWDK